jgi:hypothetical protein
VADVEVTFVDSVLSLSLSLETVNTLQTGDYLIDLVAVLDDNSTEALLVPELVIVVNRPTFPIYV